jgi:hypothetical protein
MFLTSPLIEQAFTLTTTGSMHYERAALLSGVYGGDVGQESEEKIGKSAEE